MNLAIEDIYREYSEKVMRTLIKKVGDRSDAEDLHSEIFLKVMQNIDRYDSDKASVSTWIYSITMNTVKNYYRDKRDSVALDDISESEAAVAGCDEDPSLMLSGALETLPQQQRDIVVMYFYHGYTYSEIAHILGVSERWCRELYKKAILSLKQALSEDEARSGKLIPFRR